MIKYNGISTLEVLEGAENYNSWIASKILPHTESPILEIGAGSGNISKYFKDKDITLSDIDRGLVERLQKKFKEKNITSIKIDIQKKVPIKLQNRFSTLFAVNVLEHIKNDNTALKNMRSVLKRSGKIVLLVPANQFAFTRLDKELGHFRRYSKNELVEKVVSAGFKIEKVEYFNILGLLTWILRDRVEKNDIHLKPYQIAAFDIIVPILRVIESVIKIPVGISLIIVATKK